MPIDLYVTWLLLLIFWLSFGFSVSYFAFLRSDGITLKQMWRDSGLFATVIGVTHLIGLPPTILMFIKFL